MKYRNTQQDECWFSKGYNIQEVKYAAEPRFNNWKVPLEIHRIIKKHIG